MVEHPYDATEPGRRSRGLWLESRVGVSTYSEGGNIRADEGRSTGRQAKEAKAARLQPGVWAVSFRRTRHRRDLWQVRTNGAYRSGHQNVQLWSLDVLITFCRGCPNLLSKTFVENFYRLASSTRVSDKVSESGHSANCWSALRGG